MLRRAMMGGGAVPGGDPYWPNVVSGLHGDGADGSTTFTDQKGRVWTPAGNAQIDTAQSKFGGASMLFSGGGDRIVTPSSADFGFGTGDFTVGMFVRQSSAGVAGDRSLLCVGTNGGLSVGLSGGKPFAGPNAVSYGAMSPSAIPADTWVYLEFDRASGVMYVFQDGVLAASAADTYNYSQAAAGYGAGSQNGFGTVQASYVGHIDDALITKGVARNTSAFAPPTAAFPNS